ncbi:MAG: DUF3429 domain-containing protein [Salaquimonas sp.]
MMDDDDDRQRQLLLEKQESLVWFLSLAGLIPFILPVALILLLGVSNPLADPMIALFRNYSVIILSFLGGIRWGHALTRMGDETSPIDQSSIIFSVVPSLLAWTTMFLGTNLALPILLLAFCAQGAWDSFSAQSGNLPKWFSPVRMTLTIVVALAHMAVMLISA